MTSLVRFMGTSGAELGVLEGDFVTPSGLGDDAWADQVAAWGCGDLDLPSGGPLIPVEEVGLLPPLTDRSRVFCVAQNYPAHAAEAGGASPPRPIVFLKPPSAFVGHNATAVLPAASTFFDYEGELAVVIARAGASIAADAAAGVIAGYTIANDGSARDLQPATLADRYQVDWFAAKSFDKGSALGPGVIPAATIGGTDGLRIQTTHNGELVQDDVAASMYHPIPELIAFVSRIVSLQPGDVILTGTPAGVGKARGVNLATGDIVTVSITGVGVLTTRYTCASPATGSHRPSGSVISAAAR